ncbi:MAG: HAMP domain-containing protein, partial [Clostridiales bacterium]|nr:HAMP domain-containing protein [Clostridiales bacterium]
MFQSTLLKRTMSLVVLSLVASAIIATIAFVVAGKSATLSIELDSALKIDSKINDIFSTNPEYFENSDFRYYFFSSSYAAGHDYYLVNKDGDLVNYTSQENRNISPSDTFEILTKINTFEFNKFNGMEYYIADNLEYNISDAINVSRMSLTINGNDYYLYSLKYLNGYNELIGKYLNILLLSTLMAACTMLIPAYAFVSRMVLPLQKINEVAMEYGKGNFSIRADESHKGEIGELGQSFNFLADRLSKSISDLTAERNQLQDIFDVISDGIVVVDVNSVPVTTNKAIHKLFERAEKNNMFTERLQLIPFDDVWTDFED